MIWIYGITLHDKIIYIGASIDPRRRLKNQRCRLKQQKLQLILLEEVTDLTWSARERYWIAKMRPKLNRHPGGGGGCSWKPVVDDAFRERKRSAMLKAWENPKTRKNLLTRTAARWADPEQMKRHLEKHIGAKRSAETCRKISEAKRKSFARLKAMG